MSSKPTPPSEVQFHYLKSSQFRVVHVDGIVGSVSPRGLLHMSAYSERIAIPQVAIHDVKADGTLGAARQQIGRSGIVRELEVDLMLDQQIAEALHEWLGERLTEMRTLSTTMKALQGTTAKAKKKGGR